MTKHMDQLPPFEEGIFDDQTRLIGSKCQDCDKYAFPVQRYCTKCGSLNMETCTLSTEGELYTFTTVRAALPWWKDKLPYTIGQIKLPEGITVPSQLKNEESEHLEIGAKMRIEPHEMINEQGERVKIYRFSKI
jgi:uncharacterized protein